MQQATCRRSKRARARRRPHTLIACNPMLGTAPLEAAQVAPPAARMPFDPFGARWAPGQRIGRYQVLKVLGSGGFGLTVLAQRSSSDSVGFEKLVALKILKPAFAQDEEFRLRMRDEAKLQAKLKHDQLVDVYDFHELGQELVLEMEYVEGMCLREYLNSFGCCSLPAFAAAYLGTRILRGLAWMHDARDAAHQNPARGQARGQ